MPANPTYLLHVQDDEIVINTKRAALTEAGFNLTQEQIDVMDSKAGKFIQLRDQDFDFGNITSRKSKIDALLIQSRGFRKRDQWQDLTECGRCDEGLGPFKHCAHLPSYLNSCCGNCKWHDQAAYCTFDTRNKDEKEITPPPPVQLKTGRESKRPDRLGVVEDPKAKEVKERRKAQG